MIVLVYSIELNAGGALYPRGRCPERRYPGAGVNKKVKCVIPKIRGYLSYAFYLLKILRFNAYADNNKIRYGAPKMLP